MYFYVDSIICFPKASRFVFILNRDKLPIWTTYYTNKDAAD